MMSYVTMDYKFLNKVVEQIVSETNYIDGEKYMDIPWLKHKLTKDIFIQRLIYLSELGVPYPFSYHCKCIYVLNDEEIEYVWNEYEQDIKDKMNNG